MLHRKSLKLRNCSSNIAIIDRLRTQIAKLIGVDSKIELVIRKIIAEKMLSANKYRINN